MPYIEIEDFYPLVIVRAIGPITNAELDAKLERDSRTILERQSAGSRNISIYDMTHLGRLDPIQREKQAHWMRQHQDALLETSAGTAFIVPNRVVRGIMTAVFWLQRFPLPYEVCRNEAQAVAWCIDRAQTCGLRLPRILLDLRHRAIAHHFRAASAP